ncbi:hypothetical protein PROFUN_00543 [Planoprotostelium fungivorum]|uniref:J domain-containing protein n=1 Tax=Planoprotostelium fungivorum TaxID=1890364 RepID=A0A2P6N139_9EUKA|nr:hypothetical protein PROFUN_00543 [Planoprotostelium fungivorum]
MARRPHDLNIDYYAVLEVTKTAENAEIKTAYKRLALKWHPDRNPEKKEEAEMKFKEINDAYEILTDTDRRSAYDNGKRERLLSNSGTHFKTRSTSELLNNFFSNGIPTTLNQAKFESKSTSPQAPAITRTFKCTLEELYTGTTKKMKITKEVINNKNLRKPKVEEKVITLTVEKGWRKGTKITYPKEGDVRPGEIPADVIFELDETPHDRFERRKNDLIYKTEVTLEQALCGADVKINTLNGEEMRVKVKEVIHEGYVHTVKGKGMPMRTKEEFGDLEIHFHVKYPKRIDEETKASLRKLLKDLDYS